MAKTVSLVYNGKPGDTNPSSVYDQTNWAVGEVREFSPDDAAKILAANPSLDGEQPYYSKAPKASSSAASPASTSS